MGSLPRPSPPICSFPSVHMHSAHARASAWRAGTPWSHGRPRVWSLPGTECGRRPSQSPGFPRLHGPSTDVHNRDALSSLLPSQSYSSEDGPTTLRPRKPLNPGFAPVSFQTPRRKAEDRAWKEPAEAVLWDHKLAAGQGPGRPAPSSAPGLQAGSHPVGQWPPTALPAARRRGEGRRRGRYRCPRGSGAPPGRGACSGGLTS